MPFTKEQQHEHYLENKEKLNLARSERRKLARLRQKDQVGTTHLEKERLGQVETETRVSQPATKRKEVGTLLLKENQVDETVRPEPKIFVEPPVAKSWSDYYLVKKPTCPTCQQKEISATAYQFCSEELIAPREYQCLVKHFTIYQGKNFLRQHQELVTNNFVKLEVVTNQVEQIVQPNLAEKNEVGTAQLAQEKIIREDERFITYARRLWDKKYQKYVYYSCADSCWNGKYCSNCGND